jgi:hypothetical protein
VGEHHFAVGVFQMPDEGIGVAQRGGGEAGAHLAAPFGQRGWIGGVGDGNVAVLVGGGGNPIVEVVLQVEVDAAAGDVGRARQYD